MAKFPLPPAVLAAPAAVRILRSGTRWWRVYFTAGPYAVGWNAFRHFGPTAARFDHHLPPPAVQARGIMYAAADPTTCLAEVFQATRVIDRTGRGPWLAGFELVRDVPVLELTGAWPTRAGASMAISSGQRPRARLWSQAIYAAYPAIEGLHYGSSMHANAPSLALYERASSAMPAAQVFNRALSDPALGRRLSAAAKRLGYRLV